MWTKFSHYIIKFRIPLLILLTLMTAFMGYKAREVKWSYDLAKIVPGDDPDMQYFQGFKDLFGEDGNIVAIAVKDSSIFELENFRKYNYLSEEIASLQGVTNVLSLPKILILEKDKEKKKFNLVNLFEEIPRDKETLDSLLNVASNQKFYSGQLINESNGALLMLISIDKEVVNSEKRGFLTEDIVMAGDLFTEDSGIELHYAGLPFVRSVVTGQVKKEMEMFIIISVAITGLIMLLFFRSKTAVIVPLIIIGIVVVWVMGSLALLGYKITLLVGVIPSIIVIIGIPNSIYLLNTYHKEFRIHGNKALAISRVIRKIGLATLITNSTTAVGFGVLAFTDITILKEFGLVAGLNIMATYVVSIILLPSVFYYLPAPGSRQLKHLGFNPLDKVLTSLDLLVHRQRYTIFGITSIIVAIAFIGAYKVESISYMVDDLPKDSEVKKDLNFFEQNFSGIMPLEIVVDTKEKKGIIDLKNLKKINSLELYLDSIEYLSKPVSVVSFIKASRQAFYNNNPKRYDLPTRQDRSFILRYFRNQNEDSGLMNAFVDSTGQIMRISLKVADIGSKKMDSLINNHIQPAIDRTFEDSKLEAKVTGTTPLFIKGNTYLIDNLKESFLLAFLIISLLMALLFANIRMIVISLIPNIIPLITTAGIMGYMGIPLKPSTAIVFSIAFGISVDYSIHFLAKYRQELFSNNFFVPVAVSKAIREIGVSMLYTSVVLFAGFIIFTFSDFGGTKALGFLTSITLFVSMLTNLILLPALILVFDNGKRKGNLHPLIEQYDDEFYHEEEDEEINLKKIKVGEKEDSEDKVSINS